MAKLKQLKDRPVSDLSSLLCVVTLAHRVNELIQSVITSAALEEIAQREDEDELDEGEDIVSSMILHDVGASMACATDIERRLPFVSSNTIARAVTHKDFSRKKCRRKSNRLLIDVEYLLSFFADHPKDFPVVARRAEAYLDGGLEAVLVSGIPRDVAEYDALYVRGER